MRGYVDVTSFGAVGEALETRGTFEDPSRLDVITVDSVAAWFPSAGIGIAGAVDGTASLLTTVVGVDTAARTIQLRDAAGVQVSDVRVTSDDRPAIQAAIDSLGGAGGTVFVPPGTYTLGTPGYEANAPVVVGSRTRLVGAGLGITVLRLADDVREPVPWSSPPLCPECQLVTATLIVNRGNAWYATGDRTDRAYPPQDEDIEISSMTLDGNLDGQRSLYRATDRSSVDTPRSIAAGGRSDPGTLEAGGTYEVCATYLDACGREAPVTEILSVTLTESQQSLGVVLPPRPRGALGTVIFLRQSGTQIPPANQHEQWERIEDRDYLGLDPLVITVHAPGVFFPSGREGASDPPIVRGATVTPGPAPDPAVAQPFVEGHTYQVLVSYRYSCGPDHPSGETAASSIAEVTLQPGENAIAVDPPLPVLPNSASTEVTAVRVFLRDKVLDSKGNDIGVHDVCCNPIYGVVEFDADAPIVIAELPLPQSNPSDPPDAAWSAIPPGTGKIGFANTTAGGVFFDQVSGVRMRDVEIRRCVMDGLMIASSGSETFVQDGRFENVWVHEIARCGVSITGAARSLRFAECLFDRNEGEALDIEPPAVGSVEVYALRDIHFERCRFAGSFGTAGVDLAQKLRMPIENISFTECEFDGNEIGFRVDAASPAKNIRLVGCTFRRQTNYACIIHSTGEGLLLGCTFDQNSRDFRSLPGATETAQLLFEAPASGWRVLGCLFRLYPTVDGAAIEVRGHDPDLVRDLVVVGNHFISNGSPARELLGATGGSSLVDQIIHSNVGDGGLAAYSIPPSGQLATVVPYDLSTAVPLPQGGPGTLGLRGRRVRLDQPNRLDVVFSTVPNLPALVPSRYQVAVTFTWDAGAWWIEDQTESGFSILWERDPLIDPLSGDNDRKFTLDWTLFA